MDEKARERRLRNTEAQRKLRKMKKSGYCPASNGHPGRPKLPGSWRQSGKLAMFPKRPEQSLTAQEPPAGSSQMQESRLPSSDGIAEIAVAVEQCGTQKNHLRPEDHPLPAQAGGDYDMVPQEEQTTLGDLLGTIPGQPNVAEANAMPMQQHCSCNQAPQHHDTAIDPWGALPAHHDHQELALSKTWNPPEDTYGHSTFYSGIGPVETCRIPSYEPAMAQTNALEFGHPATLHPALQHAYCAPPRTRCCSNAIDTQSDYQGEASQIHSARLGWPDNAVAIVYLPVVCPPQPYYPSAAPLFRPSESSHRPWPGKGSGYRYCAVPE
jgi:hypothetical protein